MFYTKFASHQHGCSVEEKESAEARLLLFTEENLARLISQHVLFSIPSYKKKTTCKRTHRSKNQVDLGAH